MSDLFYVTRIGSYSMAKAWNRLHTLQTIAISDKWRVIHIAGYIVTTIAWRNN